MSDELLVDVIKEGQIITVPASQARREDLFILRTREASHSPNTSNTAPSLSFSARRKERESDSSPYRTVQRWHSYQPEYTKNNVVKELVENFHWEIARARKVKNLSRAQLARALDVPEHSIKLIENGELPSDDFVLVSKVERFLGIKLRKNAVATPLPSSSTFQAPVSEQVSLASLQKLKESKAKESPRQSSVSSSSDIEIIE
jgi:ribosome-binding protein aMBF1 (putative translation factor)